MIFEPMVRLAQIVHLSCTDTNTISKQSKMRFQMTYVTLEFHQVCQKRFSDTMVRSAQTLHLSYVRISTISKQTKTSFQLNHVT
jgi:hypothetical protein